MTLDAFLCAPEELAGEIDCEEFAQVADGRVLKDTDGLLASLQERVRDELERLPKKSEEENRQQIAWCEKMLRRTGRGDAEGFFRWHWLLTDSLEIYCDARLALSRAEKGAGTAEGGGARGVCGLLPGAHPDEPGGAERVDRGAKAPAALRAKKARRAGWAWRTGN